MLGIKNFGKNSGTWRQWFTIHKKQINDKVNKSYAHGVLLILKYTAVYFVSLQTVNTIHI